MAVTFKILGWKQHMLNCVQIETMYFHFLKGMCVSQKNLA